MVIITFMSFTDFILNNYIFTFIETISLQQYNLCLVQKLGIKIELFIITAFNTVSCTQGVMRLASIRACQSSKLYYRPQKKRHSYILAHETFNGKHKRLGLLSTVVHGIVYQRHRGVSTAWNGLGDRVTPSR